MEEKPNLPVFSPGVELQHRRIKTSDWDNIYVIGDVHGCIEELNQLLSKIDPSDDELLVFVGDLTRKGPDSEGVLEKVSGMENAVSVRGNNEQKLIEGHKNLDLTRESMDYIRSLPVVVSWDENIVAHGGVSPLKSLNEHNPTELMEKRSVDGNGYEGTFWFERYNGRYRVFFGHTVLNTPVKTDSAVGLDTGCVYGGSLSAYDCSSDSFVSVEAEKSYRTRSSSDIVSTEDVKI